MKLVHSTVRFLAVVAIVLFATTTVSYAQARRARTPRHCCPDVTFPPVLPL